MKKSTTSLLLIIFSSLLVFANPQNGFIVKGTVHGLDTGTVQLAYRNISGEDTTVTAAITGGKFTINGQVPEPELARFNILTGWSYNISFFIENAEITFSLIKGAEDKTEITGSSSNIVYERLEPQLRRFFDNAHKYDAVHEHAVSSHNTTAVLSTDSIWNAQLQQWTGTIRSAIANNPKNYAGLYFIKWLLFHPLNYDTIMSLFMSLDPSVRNGLSGTAFAADYHHARQISIGQPAPEISGKDTSGNTQTLASLKGKIVLLDFWASYCLRCRQENPQLKIVYEKYHQQGFEILSVSLDYERASWTQAIQRDKMSWQHASDLRGGASASAAVYDVQDIPRNWLIDRKGNIIAIDLSTGDLNEKLEKLLK